MTSHGRFNFGALRQGGVHAPSATPDGEGGIYVIHNINQGKNTVGWNHIMSLARRLTLTADGALHVEPVSTVEQLRADHRHIGETTLTANEDFHPPGVTGNALELALSIEPREATEIRLELLRSDDGEEQTTVRFARGGSPSGRVDDYSFKADALVLDNARASLSADLLPRPAEVAPFHLAEGETLDLRIFVDKSVVELFANGRQVMGVRAYPERPDSVGVAIRSVGADATLKSLDAWQMKSIYSS